MTQRESPALESALGNAEAEGFCRLRRWLIAAFFSANLLLIVAYCIVIWLGPGYAVEETGQAMRTLALALSEQVESTLRSEEAILKSMQREIRLRGGVGAFDETAWYEMFQGHLDLFSENPEHKPLHALYYVQPDGMAVASSVSNPTKRADASKRGYFAFHRDNPSDELYISELSQSKITGLWVFFLTQRVTGPDGSFQGVLGMSLRVGRFEDLFDRLRLPNNGTISIHRLDGAPLYRHPFIESFLLPNPAAEAGIKYMAQQGAGYWETPSPFDGKPRIVGFNAGRRYPIVAAATVTREEALTNWRRALLAFTGLGAASLGISGLLLAFSLRHLGSLEREARLRRLSLTVDQNPSMIITTDADGVVDYANPAFCRFTGYSLEEIVGKTPRLLRADGVPANVYAELWKTIQTGGEWRGELRNRRKDGGVYWASLAVSPVMESGKLRGFIGVQEDISERKRTESRIAELVEELKRSNQELEQFAYVVSHDLRQPLRMITSYARLLERRIGGDAADAETREFMGYVKEGGARLDQMLTSLLEYSRVGRKGEPMQEADSRALVDEALRFLSPVIEESSAEIQVSGDWPRVVCSPNESARLFMNLIGNALKYRAPGQKPVINVSVERQQGAWLFTVRDNGVGIDPGQFYRLFKVFQRLQTRDRYEGAGVGLAVCRKIVERRGGRIWVESEGEGKGAAFFFTIPDVAPVVEAPTAEDTEI